MTGHRVEPQLFVVFGGTGDLMERKLLPALYELGRQGELPERFLVLGAARSADYDDVSYRSWAVDALAASGIETSAECRDWCAEHLCYQSVPGDADSFRDLAARVRDLEAAHPASGNRVFYLALPPSAVPGVVEGLGAVGLERSTGWTRVVVEKPFGRDLASARELNDQIHRYFDESRVYRIDHYLGKETVQNLLVLRFANPVFESLWNRDRVESVQITVAEDLGVEERAGYYDRAGAVRDVLQNHLTQLMTLVAMDVPVAFAPEDIRGEKVKVLRAMRPARPSDTVLGQYAGGTVAGVATPAYRSEPGVASGSETETFAAVRMEIDNWRWQGVPFYLRTGKRLARRVTQIVVQFQRAPVALFDPVGQPHVHRNLLAVTLQPDEGFDLRFEVKQPGEAYDLATQSLDFRYEEAFGPLADAYETLLLDVMTGDQTLFVRADEVEEAWRLVAPILDGAAPPPAGYAAGSWGPAEADDLLARDGSHWIVV